MKYLKLKLACILAILLMLQGCTKDPVPDEPITLKIWALEGSYNQLLLDEYTQFHPNILFTKVHPYWETDYGLHREIKN